MATTRTERTEAAGILRRMVDALDAGELVAIEAADVPAQSTADAVSVGVRAALLGAAAAFEAA
jgi:predicted LPLAT superfamily acyltransferase